MPDLERCLINSWASVCALMLAIYKIVFSVSAIIGQVVMRQAGSSHLPLVNYMLTSAFSCRFKLISMTQKAYTKMKATERKETKCKALIQNQLAVLTVTI